ncbi:GNAT family N-acetyltransferase [Salinarimonas sp. NSM]|uniref:GNAT family N-acetyltransferase n=1 Tax=Salinarimonas sp. NSM TaxID=3458003 RepID=UPI004036F1BB
MSLRIRPARPGEAPLVHAFVRELARYERLEHELDATEAMLDEALFGERPRVSCDFAEWDGEPVGFTLWFYTFSTFRGRHGIFVEDLFVRERARRRGIGEALLARLAARCGAEGLARLEWRVLDWNAPSIAFYRTIGAVPLDGWTTMRVTGAPLAALSGAPVPEATS